MKSLSKLFHNPYKLYWLLLPTGVTHLMPDKAHLALLYRGAMGTFPNLDEPSSFNEKLQWLKLYDHNPVYTTLVDKYAVKQWVADRIGSQYVVPTYGVWNSFDEIDFDSLPDRFVLKCTHDSGGLAICRDRRAFDFKAAREKLTRSLRNNFYWSYREWPYKDVPPRIIAEEYLDSTDGSKDSPELSIAEVDNDSASGLVDYKFYCFGGEPRFLYVSQGLEDHETARISFITFQWEFAPFGRSDYAPFEQLPTRPPCLDEMLRVARALSAGIPFVRVDLYERSGMPLFSEMTFSPCAGFMRFEPAEWDERLGQLLELPKS